MEKCLLTIIEDENEFRVVYADQTDDWVARFEKSWHEARDWAENMMNVYNSRQN